MLEEQVGFGAFLRKFASSCLLCVSCMQSASCTRIMHRITLITSVPPTRRSATWTSCAALACAVRSPHHTHSNLWCHQLASQKRYLDELCFPLIRSNMLWCLLFIVPPTGALPGRDGGGRPRHAAGRRRPGLCRWRGRLWRARLHGRRVSGERRGSGWSFWKAGLALQAAQRCCALSNQRFKVRLEAACRLDLALPIHPSCNRCWFHPP